MFGFQTNQQQINMHDKRLNNIYATLNDISNRIGEIEKTLVMSGILEKIDTTKTVSFKNQDPWAREFAVKYKVKKVK